MSQLTHENQPNPAFREENKLNTCLCVTHNWCKQHNHSVSITNTTITHLARTGYLPRDIVWGTRMNNINGNAKQVLQKENRCSLSIIIATLIHHSINNTRTKWSICLAYMFLATVILGSGMDKRDWVHENKRLTWRHRLIMIDRCRSIWLGPLSWCRFDHKLFAQYHVLWWLRN